MPTLVLGWSIAFQAFADKRLKPESLSTALFYLHCDKRNVMKYDTEVNLQLYKLWQITLEDARNYHEQLKNAIVLAETDGRVRWSRSFSFVEINSFLQLNQLTALQYAEPNIYNNHDVYQAAVKQLPDSLEVIWR